MLEDLFKGLSASAGIKEIKDLGSVFDGKDGYGHSHCLMKLSIEEYKSYFYIRLSVSYKRGNSFSKTRVIKWPYSDSDPQKLDLVINDIQRIVNAKTATELIDKRTSIGRFIDSLTNRQYYGYFEFASPKKLTDKITVSAEIADSGKETIVTLTESRKSHGFTLTHAPHDAFKAIVDKLQAYQDGKF